MTPRITTIRITAPHFVAAVVLTNSKVTEAAPILNYMYGWSYMKIMDYAARKKWKADVL